VTEPAAALKTIMETCPHAPTRLRAALAAAQMGTLLRDGTLAGELLALTDAIPVNDFDADQHDALGLVRARLLYQAGDLEGSFELARATLQRLDDRHIVNTMAVQLQAGLGVSSSQMYGESDAVNDALKGATPWTKKVGVAA